MQDSLIYLLLALVVVVIFLLLKQRSYKDDQNENKEAGEIADLKNEIVILKDGHILKSQACMMTSKSSSKKFEVKKLIKLLSKY